MRGTHARAGWGAVAALVVVLVGSARADEPTERSFREGLAAASRLRRAFRWAETVEAYGRLLEAHRGREYVADAIETIEDDLKACRFMESYPGPDRGVLFGARCTAYDSETGEVTFDFGPKLEAPAWEVHDDLAFFRHKLEPEFKIHVWARVVRRDGGEIVPAIRLLFGWDYDTQAGFEFIPGFADDEWEAPPAIVRIQKGTHRRLAHGSLDRTGGFDLEHVRLEASPGKLRAWTGYGGLLTRAVRVRAGHILLSGAAERITIKATVEKSYHATLVRGDETNAFRRWVKSHWDRERELPKWLIEAVESRYRTGGAETFLPDVRMASELMPIVLAYRTGDEERIHGARLKIDDDSVLPAASRHYLHALEAFARGRSARLALEVMRLTREAPHFGPGRALVGWVHLGARRLEPARDALRDAQRSSPYDPLVMLLAAELAVYERDLEQAAEVLDDARRRGVDGFGIDELAVRIRRAVRGPTWPTKRVVESTSVRIESDHSQQKCREVANEVERALGLFVAHFPELPAEDRKKPTIRVFASHDDYLAYADASGRELHHTAGAFDPFTRELLIWVPLEGSSFVRTVRHETFHWYVHELADRIPIWFDEGHAQWFATTTGEGRHLRPGGLDPSAVFVLREEAAGRKPLWVLLQMTRDGFYADPEIHYAQAWALVRMLRETDPARLERYFAEVVRGADTREAYRKVFAADIASLQRDFNLYVEKLVGRR